ncbi:MAG: Ryanodine receptor Ryr [Phycisphaerae bacterium]|nr:Ryanodine receptor Ryr [Phycisphaerae bacterium]
MTYQPKPLNTSKAKLPDDLLGLTERLAEHVHDVWAARRIEHGWTYGSRRDDTTKRHPNLIPYAELHPAEQQFERDAVAEALKAVVALGFKIEKA